MLLHQLADNFPVLFHMAWEGSWTSIKKHGLLSTSRLLDLYEIRGANRDAIERAHRPECVTISHPSHSNAVIRDQKPMTDLGVRRALGPGIEPAEWYAILNSMVFFWPSLERLKTMLSAKAYKQLKHDVLIVDTKPLVTDCLDRLRLSHINSGSTKPFPHPRSLKLFRTLDDFPYDERARLYGIGNALAEVCFVNGIENISDYVVDVKTIGVYEADGALSKYT